MDISTRDSTRWRRPKKEKEGRSFERELDIKEKKNILLPFCVMLLLPLKQLFGSLLDIYLHSTVIDCTCMRARRGGDGAHTQADVLRVTPA